MDLDRVTFGLLLRALGSTGDVVEALSLLRQSEDYGVRLNNYTTALAIIGCKATRQWGPALAVIRELRDERGVRYDDHGHNETQTLRTYVSLSARNTDTCLWCPAGSTRSCTTRC